MIEVDPVYARGQVEITTAYAQGQPVIYVQASDLGGAVTAVAAAQLAKQYRDQTEDFRDETEGFRNDAAANAAVIAAALNIDGGYSNTVYGGLTPLDAGGAQ